MTDNEQNLRRQIAAQYERYRRHSDAARDLLDDGEDHAGAAAHAALAQGAAAMANTLALLLNQPANA